MTKVTMKINGKSISREVEGQTLLSSLLRDDLRTTGTHVGCDTSQCGACVVHVDGASVKSCAMFAVEADGAEVTTIECRVFWPFSLAKILLKLVATRRVG